MFVNTLLFALFAYITMIKANGNLAGSCLANGTKIDPAVPGGGIYSSYCPTGYGRPQGVCNCVSGLNSCLANLAGCPGTEQGIFSPPIPPVIYVGQEYEFRINISFATLNSLCFLRPLPSNLTWAQVNPGALPIDAEFAIFGTPIESIPSANYGVAASRGQANGGFSAFFSVEVQSCSVADAVYPTMPPTTPPASPAASVASPPTTTCTSAQNGYTRCAGASSYQTCDHGMWQAAQMCTSGLVCKAKANGQHAYCDRA